MRSWSKCWNLLAEVEVLQQRRAARAGAQRVLVVADGMAEVVGQLGRRSALQGKLWRVFSAWLQRHGQFFLE